MSYEITLSIQEDSPQGRNIEAVAETEHLSREEAALKLLSVPTTSQASPAARRILGAFKQEADVMDEALELAMSDRQRRNAAPLHD